MLPLSPSTPLLLSTPLWPYITSGSDPLPILAIFGGQETTGLHVTVGEVSAAGLFVISRFMTLSQLFSILPCCVLVLCQNQETNIELYIRAIQNNLQTGEYEAASAHLKSIVAAADALPDR